MGNITNTGYEVKSKEDIRTSIQDLWKEAFGPNINMDVETPQGQITEIMTDLLYQIEVSRQDDFNARDVYKAVGLQLDIIGREIGAPRKSAIPTQLVVTINGSTGYTIPSGTLFNMVDDVNQVFRTENDIVISSDAQQATLIAIDGNVYGGIQTGDGLQTVTYFQQISNIVVVSVVAGQLAEDDNTYRSRLIELKDSGIDDVANLRSKLTAINNVLDAKVYQNNSLDTDAHGIPSHCIEIVVLGGNEADIGTVCLQNVVMGTPTYLNPSGGETITVIDSQGYPQQYNITRPTSVEFDVSVEYAPKANQVISHQDEADMISRVTQYLNTRFIGQTVYMSDISYLLLDGVQTKLEIVSLTVKADGVEIQSSYTLGIRQYAVAGTVEVEEAGE